MQSKKEWCTYSGDHMTKKKQNNYLMATFHPLPFCLSIFGPSATLRESAGLCVTVEHLVPKQVVVICGLAMPLHGKH